MQNYDVLCNIVLQCTCVSKTTLVMLVIVKIYAAQGYKCSDACYSSMVEEVGEDNPT